MSEARSDIEAQPPERHRERRSRGAAYAFVAAGVLLSAVLAYPWPRPSAPLIAIGQRQPIQQIVLEQMDGGTWRLSEHRGQVVLLNYWASWCGPCRTETPGLVRLSQSVQGLAVVGIAMDTGDPAPVRSFVQHLRVGYPIAFPPPLSQMSAGMVGLPTTVLLDREGRVAKTYIGETREREFRKDVEMLLTE